MRHYKIIFALLAIVILISAADAFGQTNSFTYQGKLNVSGVPASGPYDFQFRFYETNTGGPQLGITVAADDVTVTNGIFTVELNFGPGAITPGQRWIEIEVRPGASTGAYNLLSPRQKITDAPYSTLANRAMSADTAGSAGTAETANDANTVGGLSPSVFIQEGDLRLSDARQPLAGSSSYVQTNPGSPQSGGFDVAGNGKIGSSLTVFGATFLNSNVSVSGTLSGNGSGLTGVVGTMRWQAVSGTSQQAQANNGYMTAGDGQVTITLPPSASLAFGDTVRVSGTGEGGWRIAQNAGQTVLGANLGLVGVFWTARETNRNWYSIASSSNGSKLAAVVPGEQVYTSTDSGATWTARDPNRNWNSIASSSDGSKLAAGVNGGQIYTSTDSGTTWTARMTDANRNWQSIASSSDGSRLAAVDYFGKIYTSIDSGATWTARMTDANRLWHSIASSSDGSMLAAVVAGGQIYTSTDSGATWTARETNRPWRSIASSSDGSKLAAVVNGGQIYTSTNWGATWTARMTDANRNWQSIASSSDGSKLAAPSFGGQIYTSTDSGANWTARETNRNWTSIASSSDGSKLAAAGSNEQIYTSVPNTTLGTAGYLAGAQGTAIELQYIGNGKFLPISHEGTITGF